MRKLPRSWKCDCGAEHEFGMWYAAHSREHVTHTCTECKRKHRLFDYLLLDCEPGCTAAVTED